MSVWLTLLPEGVLALIMIVLLLADLGRRPHGRARHLLPGLALAGILATLAALWFFTPSGPFDQAMLNDSLARYLKTLILLAAGFVILCSWDTDAVYGRPQGEYLFLLLSATLGMMILAGGTELVLLYVGLELATFPLVLLTAYLPGNAKSAEGGLKYLMLAALGSAILLFGFSLLYAVTGATSGAKLSELVAHTADPMTWFGIVCVVAGIGFKISAVPFHVWAPDAYEGAPTPVTAFLSVGSKTAGFALALRLLAGLLPLFRPQWSMMLACIAAATMLLGNFAAIPQSNLKRLLAYSSIAQAGYILMGLVAFQMHGLSSLLYYLAAYLATNLAAFAVLLAVERSVGSADIGHFAGLAQRSPRLALVMLLALLSLAGIPPLAGFTAKFYIFTAAYGQGFGWLVWVAVFNSALSLYYYLRVVRAMYILPPDAEAAKLQPLPVPLIAVLLICTAGILILGLYPGPFVSLAQAALASVF